MAEITKYEIDMLNVKAADAFLIHLFTSKYGFEYEYVILVDAGNESDGDLILEHIQKYYKQKYIDLAICTHCDSDHYGGFKRLIEEHKKHGLFEIKQMWVHDPYSHVDVDDVKYIRKEQTLRERLHEAYSFTDGTNLIECLDQAGIKRSEPFTGMKYAPANITVLGPDKRYYESLIPEFRVDVKFKEEEVDEEYSPFRCYSTNLTEEAFYSKALEDADDDGSKVNQSSVIFMFEVKGEKHLFTGDAGREALHRVIDYDWRNNYSDIDFLKVPHHGSKHNLDNAIIDHLKPRLSYISTEKYGKYANRCVVNALKKCGKVYSTHKESSSIWNQCGTDDRPTYSKATPL